MDMDEWKAKWAEQDAKLETNLRLNRQILSTIHLSRAKSNLQRLVFSWTLEAMMLFAVTVFLGNFIYEHRTLPRFVFLASFLDVGAIAYFVAQIRLIIAATNIDFGEPITLLLKQMEALRVLIIRMTLAAIILGTIVWVPALLVVLKAVSGVDIYPYINKAWLVGNILFGLALIPLAFWVSKRYRAQMHRSPFLQRLMKDIAGHSLNEAMSFLTELSLFEEEK